MINTIPYEEYPEERLKSKELINCRVKNIHPYQETLPEYFVKLLKKDIDGESNDNNLINLHDVFARLFHCLMIEVGCFSKNIDVPVLQLLEIHDLIRVYWNGLQFPSGTFNSNSGFYSFNYKGIIAEEDSFNCNDNSEEEDEDYDGLSDIELIKKAAEKDRLAQLLPKHIRYLVNKRKQPKARQLTSQVARSGKGKERLAKIRPEVEKDNQSSCKVSPPEAPDDQIENSDIDNYLYSKPCDLILIRENDVLSVTGIVRYKDSQVPRIHRIHMDIRSFMEPLKGVTEDGNSTKYHPVEFWTNSLKLFGPSLSDYFKNNFAIPLLDLIECLIFESRYLFSLPPEIFIHIISYLKLNEIVKLRRTCTYFNYLIGHPKLWNKILSRNNN